MAVIKPKGIEKFVCSQWEGWDEVDTGVLMFYAPAVHQEILDMLGNIGKVTSIVVNTQDCTVDFYNEEDTCVTLDFKVSF